MSAELAKAMFPRLPPEWLEVAAAWTAWSFAADDQLDRCDDPARALARAEELRRHAELGRIVGAFGRRADARQTAAFVQHVGDFLDACVWEAGNRQLGTPPPVESYRLMRPFTGAMWPFLRIALAALELPLEVERHPEVRRALAAAAWLPCLDNDIVSAAKELRGGEWHNAVILHMRAAGLTLSQALGAARRDYQRQLAEYERLLADLRAQALLSEEAHAALSAVVGGAHRWLAKSRRYSLEGAAVSSESR
jgi:Terpene synthase family 2, C-terminal metal binding